MSAIDVLTRPSSGDWTRCTPTSDPCRTSPRPKLAFGPIRGHDVVSVVSAGLLVGAILALLTAPLIDPWLEAKRTAATLSRRD